MRLIHTNGFVWGTSKSTFFQHFHRLTWINVIAAQNFSVKCSRWLARTLKPVKPSNTQISSTSRSELQAQLCDVDEFEILLCTNCFIILLLRNLHWEIRYSSRDWSFPSIPVTEQSNWHLITHFIYPPHSTHLHGQQKKKLMSSTYNPAYP